MRIAVASTGKSEDSEVNPVAGRAPYYLVYENGKLVKTLKNPFAVGGGGAGFGVAKMLADEKVGLIVAGRFGDNMMAALDKYSMKPFEQYGTTVKQASENAAKMPG